MTPGVTETHATDQIDGTHFTWTEFECHDAVGTPYPVDRRERGVKLAHELERIRGYIGPFTPSSIYRTWAYHKAIYDAMKPPQPPPVGSRHLHGDAADITKPNAVTWPVFVESIVAASKEEGSLIRYIKFYRAQKFAHIDLHPRRADKSVCVVEYNT